MLENTSLYIQQSSIKNKICRIFKGYETTITVGSIEKIILQLAENEKSYCLDVFKVDDYTVITEEKLEIEVNHCYNLLIRYGYILLGDKRQGYYTEAFIVELD